MGPWLHEHGRAHPATAGSMTPDPEIIVAADFAADIDALYSHGPA